MQKIGRKQRRETAVDVFSREAEVTIHYLEERRKNEALKDELTIESLKASIRHHESAAKAYEAKTAYYQAKLQKEGLAVSAPVIEP